MSGDDCHDEERPHKYMAITNMEENPYQGLHEVWTLSEVSDMCIPDDPIIKNTVDDMAYFDENTWEILNQQLVKEAEKAEIARFKKMGVYSYVSRSEALNDPDGSFVKVKWVRTNKGTAAQANIRCRLVAEEIGYGQRIDELFSGTPSLTSTKMATVHAAKGGARHCGHGREVCFSLRCLSPPYLHRASPPRPQARCGRSCMLAPEGHVRHSGRAADLGKGSRKSWRGWVL